jgi:hypothetical protein
MLRTGARGKAVSELQGLLNRVLRPDVHLGVDGHYGPKTRKAVQIFQRDSKLVVDGIVGPKTWRALSDAMKPRASKHEPQHQLAEIAKQYIGAREVPDNRAGERPRMLEIFKADNLEIDGKTDGYPWCAAFVSLCVQKLCRQSPYFGGMIPPREPSVSRFLNVWAKQADCLIFEPNTKHFRPEKGDIAVFVFSHIGIVETNNGKSVATIEGNTNAAGDREGRVVARKQRPLSIVRSFIRLPVSTIQLQTRLDEIARVV